VQRCKEVYNGSIGENWGFVKLTDAEFHYLAKRMAQMADPRQVLLAEINGNTVGFSITLPDINEAIRPLNGRLTTFGLPIGLVRLLYRIRRVKAARMVVLGLLADFRRRGIGEMLILQTLDYGKNTIGYTGAELGWTLEDNRLINRTVEAVGAKRYKTYRIYEKNDCLNFFNCMSMTLKREVVITGIGIVSPIGIGKDPFWQSFVRGRAAGCGRLTCSNSAVVRPRLAPRSLISIPNSTCGPRKSLKLMSREIQLAFAAADMAYADSGLGEKPLDPNVWAWSSAGPK